MSVQFISGLPQQLAFFVRARNPSTLHDTLAAAKLGQTFGYLSKHNCEIDPIEKDNTSSDIAELRAIVSDLASTVQAMQINGIARQHPPPQPPPSQFIPSQHQLLQPLYQLDVPPRHPLPQHPVPQCPPSNRCTRCGCPGHLQPICSLSDNTSPRLHFRCTLCHQYGHGSMRCKSGNGFLPATVPK